MSRAFSVIVLALVGLSAAADVVVLTDGKTLEGRVTETDKGVQVVFPNGGSSFVPKDRVVRIEHKPSVVDQYLEKRRVLKEGDIPATLDLAEWAAAHELGQAARKLARDVLAKEPGNVRAHAVLGEWLVGGVFLTAAEAERRGFAPLASGWGEWDRKYEEDEAGLKMTPEALAQARAALASATAASDLAALPSRAWSVLLHRYRPVTAVSDGLPASGRLELGTEALAWAPPAAGKGEVPCLIALADPADTQGPESAYAYWEALAKARGIALLCPAPGKTPRQALDLLRARGVPVDLTRVVLAGIGGGADAGWALLEREPDRYSGAVLVSGASATASYPDAVNAAGLGVFILFKPEDLPPLRRRLSDLTNALSLRRGRVSLKGIDALPSALDEALAGRRPSWPAGFRRQVRAGETHAWARVETLAPLPPGEAATLEGRVAPGNALFLAGHGVSHLSLLLSDDLVDLSKPVTVTLNGREAFHGMVTPDLGGMLARFRAEGDRHRAVTAVLAVEAKQ